MNTRPLTRLLPAAGLVLLLSAAFTLEAQNAAPVLAEPRYMDSGAFQCQLLGEPGVLCEVQVSSDLKTWRSLAQIRLRETSHLFEDPAAANFDPRFYRVFGPIDATSPAVVEVFPSSASPGMSVRVKTDGPAFSEEGPNAVRIDGVAVPALWVGSKTEADVLVPTLPGGEASVRLQLTGQRPGKAGSLLILPARTRLLVLSYEDETLKLLGDYPCGDQPEGPAPRDERRLSLDIFNGQGGLLASCAVPHPATPIEVFDSPGKGEPGFRRVPALPRQVLAIKVPVVPGPVLVRCYDTEPGVDLTRARDRETRRLLNEIELTIK